MIYGSRTSWSCNEPVIREVADGSQPGCGAETRRTLRKPFGVVPLAPADAARHSTENAVEYMQA